MSPVPLNSLPAELESIPAWRSIPGGYARSGCHFDLCLEADHLLPAVRRLFDHGYFLEDIVGVDVEEGIMLIYHFDRYEAARRPAADGPPRGPESPVHCGGFQRCGLA
jgi:hypothetical protein